MRHYAFSIGDNKANALIEKVQGASIREPANSRMVGKQECMVRRFVASEK